MIGEDVKNIGNEDWRGFLMTSLEMRNLIFEALSEKILKVRRGIGPLRCMVIEELFLR